MARLQPSANRTALLLYGYDASGNRISKAVSISGNTKTTWYVRDANGNVMGLYEQRSDLNSGHLTETETHLYGSSRLGVFNINRDLTVTATEITLFERGHKYFELSNHLQNVLATISDKKIGVDQNSDGTVDYYNADVITANDMYSAGMIMPGRRYNNEADYRYSINGQEKTPEIAPNTTTAEFWQYDARIVRRWDIDPKPNFSISPYNCFAGNPIWFFDSKGDTVYNDNPADDKTIQNWIGKGLNLKKGKVNPFSFNKDGYLKINKTALSKLTKSQQGIAKEIVTSINAKDFLEIELVDVDEILETRTVNLPPGSYETDIIGYKQDGKTPIYKDYFNGDVINETIMSSGGGHVKPAVINGNAPGSNYVLTQIVRQDNKGTVKGVNGVQIANPNYIILFHEAFGHFVNHNVKNSCTQNQDTIDYENKVRRHNGLTERPKTDGKNGDHPADYDY